MMIAPEREPLPHRRAPRLLLMSHAPDSSHPMFPAWGIDAPPRGVMQYNGNLVVPMMDEHGHVVSCQIIGRDGHSWYLANTSVPGQSFAVGRKVRSVVRLTETLARAARIHQDTGDVCLVCFEQDNIGIIARQTRAKFPTTPIVIHSVSDEAIRAARDVTGCRIFGALISGVPDGDG